jgi:hypothetical protein
VKQALRDSKKGSVMRTNHYQETRIGTMAAISESGAAVKADEINYCGDTGCCLQVS